jgi:hypothetical protein
MTSPRKAKRRRRAPTGAAAADFAQSAEEKTFARLKRALRKAERRAGDGSAIGGTGATILKLQPPPLARLLDRGRIGTEEVRAADEIAMAFRDGTAGNGDYSVTAVTAALSLTIPATATLGFANAAPGRIWLAAVNNAGTVSLAAINCFNAAGGAIFPLGGWSIANITAMSTSATAAQTFYGPATLSAVPYSVLGYASYETGSTLAIAGIWSAKPTRLELLRPGVPLPGAVVQSLYNLNAAASTGTNSYSPSATVPTAAGGNLVTAQAITPTSSANLLRVKGEAMLGTTNAGGVSLTAFLTQDAGTNAVATTGTTSSFATSAPSKICLLYQAPAATLIATTFKLWGTAGGGATVDINSANGGSAFFGGTANSFLLVEEIMA